MRLAPIAVPALLLSLTLPACGGDGATTATTAADAGRPVAADRLRDEIVSGAARDFREGTGVGPVGFGRCFRIGLRRALTRSEMERLIAVFDRPHGRPFTAQALNELAVPIGDRCGGRQFVPELVHASRALAGAHLRDPRGRRLGLVYGPYLGVSCPTANATRCDRVGIDLVLSRDATAVTATVGGRAVRLRTPGLHSGVAGRDWVGFLRGVGLERPQSPFYTGRNGRAPRHWAGSPAVYLPVRIEVSHPDGSRNSARLAHVFLSPGWG